MEGKNYNWITWVIVIGLIWGSYSLFSGDATKLSSSISTFPTTTQSDSRCNSNYSGCLKKNAGDYDCSGGSGNGPNYTGRVQVLGYDEYGLDKDGDGWGCEN